MGFRTPAHLLLCSFLLARAGQATWNPIPGPLAWTSPLDVIVGPQSPGGASSSQDTGSLGDVSDLKNYTPDQGCPAGTRSCAGLGIDSVCCPEVFVLSRYGVLVENTCTKSSRDPSGVVCCVDPYHCDMNPRRSISCSEGSFECSASLGGGCCPIGYTCSQQDCIEELIPQNSAQNGTQNGTAVNPGPDTVRVPLTSPPSLQEAMCAAGLHSDDCSTLAHHEEGAGRLNASRFPKRGSTPAKTQGSHVLKTGKIVGESTEWDSSSIERGCVGVACGNEYPQSGSVGGINAETGANSVAGGNDVDDITGKNLVDGAGEAEQTLTLTMTASGIYTGEGIAIIPTAGTAMSSSTTGDVNPIAPISTNVLEDPLHGQPAQVVPQLMPGDLHPGSSAIGVPGHKSEGNSYMKHCSSFFSWSPFPAYVKYMGIAVLLHFLA
ncbi:hypothetical protein TWF696_000682 [Orbilia brochopaga]|uniref:Uncharacterized protein n=1 Tax=Orbilia brochopaga TaxID=3140254 RepID=A0AAV9VFJ9_9PEZI